MIAKKKGRPRSPVKMGRLQVRIPDDLLSFVRHSAAMNGRPLGEEIRRRLEQTRKET